MTRIELTRLLGEIGITLRAEPKNRYRWASRPLKEEKPILRFQTLKDAENFWMAHCLHILYQVRRIDESIREAAEANPNAIGAVARWLNPSTPDPYPAELEEATSRLPEYTRPRHWKTEIVKEASELGPVHNEWVVRRACYYRSLARYGYHVAPTGNCEPLSDKANYS